MLVSDSSAFGCSCVGVGFGCSTILVFLTGSAFTSFFISCFGVRFSSMTVGITTGSGVGAGTTSFGFSPTSGIVSGMSERGCCAGGSCDSGICSFGTVRVVIGALS